MRVIRKWWRGLRATPSDASSAAYGPGTCVSADELLQLRHAAAGIALGNRSRVGSMLAGGYASRFRGRGMDYLESRSYQQGDDIRNMDWRVTARACEPHVKLFQEERERPVVVMVDLNPTMFFGTRGAYKSVIAARAAALIGWAAVANGDRIGALLFNGGHEELQPCGRRRGVLRLIRKLVSATEPVARMKAEQHPDRLNEALPRLRRVARPGSLIFVLSDFYAMDDTSGKHLQYLRRHNDVLAVQIVDALELAPPPPGLYGVTDGVNTGILDLLSRTRQDACSEYLARHHRQIREQMRQRAINLLQLNTADEVSGKLRLGLAGISSRAAPVAEKVA